MMSPEGHIFVLADYLRSNRSAIEKQKALVIRPGMNNVGPGRGDECEERVLYWRIVAQFGELQHSHIAQLVGNPDGSDVVAAGIKAKFDRISALLWNKFHMNSVIVAPILICRCAEIPLDVPGAQQKFSRTGRAKRLF